MRKNTKKLEKSIELLVQDTWKTNQPKWFVTLLWNDRPSEVITAISHARHFKNVFLRELYGKRTVGRLPVFPERMGMTIFHERKDDAKGKKMYHTHIHMLGDLCHLKYGWEVDWHIRSRCLPHIQKLLKSDADGNNGIDVKEWAPDRHANYNYKDYKRFRNQQDGDLVLDYENSDFSTLP